MAQMTAHELLEDADRDTYEEVSDFAFENDIDLTNVEFTRIEKGFQIANPKDGINDFVATYLGFKVGFPFFLGIDASLIKHKNSKPNFGFSAKAESSAVVSSISLGGHKYIGKKRVWGLGARGNFVHAVDVFSGETVNTWAYGPEATFNKQIKDSRTYLNLQGGAIYIQSTGAIAPNVSIGLQFKLGQKKKK
jgi:hypothetical protein